MKKTDIAVVAQFSWCWNGGLLVMLLAVCFAGCQTTATISSQRHGKGAYADDTHRLDSADAGAEVEARTAQGNWRFLACFTDAPEAMNVPGLFPEEGMEFLDSCLFETEVFFDQRALYVIQFEGDPKPWIDAKWRYAEKVNRALVKKIRDTGRISSSLSTAPRTAVQPLIK